MSLLHQIFGLKPTMKQRSQLRLDFWVDDREGAVKMFRTGKPNDVTQEEWNREWDAAMWCESRMNRRLTALEEARKEREAARRSNLREGALKSSRFSCIRGKRGLPFRPGSSRWSISYNAH